MYLENIYVSHFRNYNDFQISFQPSINIIYGNNAQGKTNLLEAIYVLGMTKSHRSFIDSTLIQKNESAAYIKGNVFFQDQTETLEIGISKTKKLLNTSGEKRPISMQIFGSDAENMGFAAKSISEIADILDRQNVLIERQSGGEKVEKTYLDNELDELKKNIEEYIEVNKDKKLSNEQKQEIEKILEKFSKYEESNQKYFDGKPQRIFEVDEKISVLTRSDKDIYQNLKTVAKESDKIPKEHLLNYLDRLLKNTEKNKVLEKITESTDEEKTKQIILENPLIDHNKKSEKNLNKVYKSIFDRTNGSVRKALDTEFRYIAEYDQDIKRMVSKGDTSPEGVRELAEKLQELKAEAFKAVLGVEYEKIPIEVQKLDGNLAGGNDGIKLKIYLDDEDSFDYVFETIVHELTHQDQKNLQKINIQGFEDRNKLYELNSLEGGYISTFGKDYETQPIEKEAHDSEKIAEEVLKSIRENEDAASYEDSYDEDNRFDILDEPNAFDLPQDDGIREEIKDTAGEEVIVPEYYEPLTGNPEDYKEKKKSNNLLDKNENKGLGETPLIYGTTAGRKTLVNEALSSENKNPHIANVYLSKFNYGSEQLGYEPLVEFAKKFLNGSLKGEDHEEVVKFYNSDSFLTVFSEEKLKKDLHKYEKEQILRVSEEANQKIIDILLKNEKITEVFENILKANENLVKNSDDENMKRKLEQAIDKFFELKTVTILEETFNNGGKIYFSLDEIATSNGKINLDKVLEVFNESHPMYHSITSAELRTAFRKYLDHPDLKFFLSKQVIELPNELKEKIKKEVEFENFKNQNPINNKNLLSFIPERDLGKTALVYGTKFGKGGLLRESSKSLNKNPHFTDAYLGKLNLGNENQEMIKFAEKVVNGTLTDKDKEEIINPFPLLKNYKTDYTENQIGRVKEKANEELLNLVLEKDEVLKALNQITSGAEKIKKDKNSIEGKKEIEEGVQNFIKEKQIIILEKTFERGGKIYFSLDEIILTQNKDINFDRLLEVFDKSSKNYNSITSSELRNVFEKYLEHPNLKFVLGKQVIELPQKTKEKIKDMVSKNIERKNNENLALLDKPNAFDLPQDDGVRIEINDTANEPEIVAEHYEPLTGLPEKYRKEEKASKNNRNIEADVKNEKLGDSPLSYGTTSSRGYLLEAIEDSPNKNNKTADSYLGKLNEGNNYEHLIELATKVTSKTLTSEDIEKVLDFDSSSFKTADKRYQREYEKVNSEVNRELLQEIIADKRVQKIFEKISKSAANIASGKKTLKDEITLNNSIHDFFIAKTSIVLEKTLKGDGQVYFSITEVIADKKGNINFDKLLNVFSPSSANYDSVTSAELRVIFQKYLDHPNLKFVIGKHVIELPSEIKEKIKKERLLFNKKYSKNMNMLDGEAFPEIDMDTYDPPLNVDDILDSENLGRFVARVKNSILLRYGPENFNNVKEYFNLENPIVRDMVRKDLEKALLLSNEPVTGDNLDAFLSKNILENIRKQTEKHIEYNVVQGFGGVVYNRTHDEIKKQLQLVSDVADKLPSEHLQNFLANMFMNKEAMEIYNKIGNQGKKMVSNENGIKFDVKDQIAVGNIYKHIKNDFTETRKKMDDKLINKLAINKQLQDFITQNGIIDKNLLREVYLENPEFVIEKIYDLNVKDISNEDIGLLLSVISEERKKVFEEVLQTNYEDSVLNVFEVSPTLKPGELAFHDITDGSINIIREGISTFGLLLDTLLHETQHQDQKLLSENKDSNMIPEATKELYLLNHYAYIDGKDLPPQLFNLYEDQPNEKEAFAVARSKELIKMLVEDMIN